MGYQMPNVVKTILLPLEYDFLLELSGVSWPAFVEEYKKRYGIDLNDIFKITILEEEVKLEIISNSFILAQCELGVINPLASVVNTYNPSVGSNENLLVLDSSSFKGVENGLSITISVPESYSNINDIVLSINEF